MWLLLCFVTSTYYYKNASEAQPHNGVRRIEVLLFAFHAIEKLASANCKPGSIKSIGMGSLAEYNLGQFRPFHKAVHITCNIGPIRPPSNKFYDILQSF